MIEHCNNCKLFVNRREIPQIIGVNKIKTKLPPENWWQKIFPKVEVAYEPVYDPEKTRTVGDRLCSAKSHILTQSGDSNDLCIRTGEFKPTGN